MLVMVGRVESGIETFLHISRISRDISVGVCVKDTATSCEPDAPCIFTDQVEGLLITAGAGAARLSVSLLCHSASHLTQ